MKGESTCVPLRKSIQWHGSTSPFFCEGEWEFEARGSSPGASSLKLKFFFPHLFSPSACSVQWSVTWRVLRSLITLLLLPSWTSWGWGKWIFALQWQKVGSGKVYSVQRSLETALGARLVSHLLSFCRNCCNIRQCSKLSFHTLSQISRSVEDKRFKRHLHLQRGDFHHSSSITNQSHVSCTFP